MGDDWVFVKHMSSDDIPDSVIAFVKALESKRRPLVLIALCPNFTDEKTRKTREIIKIVREKGYEIFFWVLQKQYGGERVVAEEEIGQLKLFGQVQTYEGRAESPERSGILKRQITKWISQSL